MTHSSTGFTPWLALMSLPPFSKMKDERLVCLGGWKAPRLAYQLYDARSDHSDLSSQRTCILSRCLARGYVPLDQFKVGVAEQSILHVVLRLPLLVSSRIHPSGRDG